MKEKFECDCGSICRKSDKTRHEKSLKHQNWLKSLYSSSNSGSNSGSNSSNTVSNINSNSGINNTTYNPNSWSTTGSDAVASTNGRGDTTNYKTSSTNIPIPVLSDFSTFGM